MSKKWDVSFTVNGFLAGLVAITCPCYWVSPTGAILLGGIAGVIVVIGVEVLEYLRIDDPIGAVPVHGMCGIWGTLSLGLFAAASMARRVPSPDNSAPLKGFSTAVGRSIGGAGKESQGQGSPDAAHAVDRNRADRIVNAEILQQFNAENHQHSGDSASMIAPIGLTQ